MPGNSFGTIFRLTSFGESHGPAVGGVLDGCPAGLTLDLGALQHQLDRRRPGQSALTTPRNETDELQLLSGVFKNETTGTPIGFLLRNKDARPADYEAMKDVFRPGHADYTYAQKYGLRDYRGGGRSSARETTARVVAGAIAQQFLQVSQGVRVLAWVEQVHHLRMPDGAIDPSALTEADVDAHATRCPHLETAAAIEAHIAAIRDAGDSVGGVIAGWANVPAGWGEPVFDKLPAVLGHGLLSLNAVKGVEFGTGFGAALLTGSEHNDPFAVDAAGAVHTTTDHAGGTLGGISSGQPLRFRVAFKPTSTIRKSQHTVTASGEAITLAAKGRHDPCVLPRAVPIVQAITAHVLADLALQARLNRV